MTYFNRLKVFHKHNLFSFFSSLYKLFISDQVEMFDNKNTFNKQTKKSYFESKTLKFKNRLIESMEKTIKQNLIQ